MSIAAVLLMREHRLVRRLRDAGATTPEAAQTIDEIAAVDGLAMRRLRKRAVICESHAGAFYLDEDRWSSLRRMRRRIMAGVIGVGLAVAIAAYFFAGR